MQLKSVTIVNYNSETFYPNTEDRCTFLGETENSIKFKIGANGIVRYLNKELFKNQKSGIMLFTFSKMPPMVIYDADRYNEIEGLKTISEHILWELENKVNFQSKVTLAIEGKYQELFN